MDSVMNVEASILARITKRVKIVLLGNPLPVVGNPLRLAEELGMIDMISGGRLVSGWVRRGGGSEQFASNANPAFNREYFNEAHEVVIQAWTRPGPPEGSRNCQDGYVWRRRHRLQLLRTSQLHVSPRLQFSGGNRPYCTPVQRSQLQC
jgi:alkanesulfonate monooxygenase SsuD/methylene tetrahydromethanopterin reductase-like flavin-dependent oxidoreductase (luciferase family)